jgi:hypothetical protein
MFASSKFMYFITRMDPQAQVRPPFGVAPKEGLPLWEGPPTFPHATIGLALFWAPLSWVLPSSLTPPSLSSFY